jgi:hypothetical protein
MKLIHTINICNDFTDAPGARYRLDGPKSGEEFLEELLEPWFLKAKLAGEILRIELDGTWGYASSFISGSFGELSKKYGRDSVCAHIHLVSEENPLLLDKIKNEIDESGKKNG